MKMVLVGVSKSEKKKQNKKQTFQKTHSWPTIDGMRERQREEKERMF